MYAKCVLGIYVFFIYLFHPNINVFMFLSIICTNKELHLNLMVQYSMTINISIYLAESQGNKLGGRPEANATEATDWEHKLEDAEESGITGLEILRASGERSSTR